MNVLDDLTPEENRAPGWCGRPHPKREPAFRSGLLVASEVRPREDAAALLLARYDAAEDSPGGEPRGSRRAKSPGRKEPS